MVDPDRLILAQTLTCHGRTREAEAIYHEVLNRQPDALEALWGLGALAYQLGRVDQAAALFARGLALRPDMAELHANFGESLRLLKRHDEALAHLQKALALRSDLPDASNSLGLLLHDLRRYPEAESAYREAIRHRPEFNAALINLAMTLQAQGRIDDATRALKTAVEREPDSAPALTNLGMLLLELNDPAVLDEAESLCRRAVAIAPRLAPAINNLGNVLKLKGRLDEAIACYHKALQLDPCRGKARWNIGQILVHQGLFEDAMRVFEEAQAVDPDHETYHLSLGGLWAMRHDHLAAARHYRLAIESNAAQAEAHHGLALALLEQGRLHDAEASLDDALALAPKRPNSLSALARIQAERGDITASCQLARRALDVQPNHADAYCQLAVNLRGQLNDTDLREIERLARQDYVSEETRALLHFAQATVYDERAQFAAAARCLETANALHVSARRTRGVIYDPDQHSELLDRLMTTLTPDFLAERTGWGDADSRPVFVVGLPRTGSSLVEQILASHPLIHGAGEVTYLQELFHALPELTGLGDRDRISAIAALDPQLSRVAARYYLDRLEDVTPPSALRVIDKLPENMSLVGLIQLLLPASRVIVCRRDPRDVALSCWQTAFATIPWANDVEHIARRIADHRRLLEYGRRATCNRWFEIDYEDLVADLEGNSRRLVQFLDLEWDPACLQFHMTRRVVRTASNLQVRKPVYQRSVGRWRNYETSLNRLWLALKRHGVIDRVEPDDRSEVSNGDLPAE